MARAVVATLSASCLAGCAATIACELEIDRLGRPIGRLYDGSWSEWGGRAELPVVAE